MEFEVARPSWDDYLMSLALVTSMRSLDSTKHGSILADKYHRILGVGYNGFLRGCDDSTQPLTRPEKYARICHAEINCILNSHIPYDTTGCSLYVTGCPCIDCIKVIAQAGIKRVVYGPIKSACVTNSMLDDVKEVCNLVGIDFVEYTGDISTCLRNAITYINSRR